MFTTRYRIRIDAIAEGNTVVCSMEQSIEQAQLTKARPRELIRFIESFVRTFLNGHRATEKALAKEHRLRKPRVKKLGLSSLLDPSYHD